MYLPADSPPAPSPMARNAAARLAPLLCPLDSHFPAEFLNRKSKSMPQSVVVHRWLGRTSSLQAPDLSHEQPIPARRLVGGVDIGGIPSRDVPLAMIPRS